MDIRLKKTALAAVLGLGLVGLANAAGFTPPPAACMSMPVTIPCESEAWGVAIEGFYFQQIVNDQTSYYNYNVNGNNYKNFFVDPDFDFGFRLEGSYYFSTGNDLTLNWTRFHDTTTDNNTFADISWNQIVLDGANASDFDTEARLANDFDAVNLEFGQHFDVGNNLDLRLHVGAQYARLDHSLRVEGSYDEDWAYIQTASDFTGFGPRVGMDWNYHLGNSVDFVARFAGELLVGNIDTDYSVCDYASSGPTTTDRYLDNGSRTVIVPATEGRLGLSYTHDMSDEGRLVIEGGWHAAAYVDSIIHVDGDYNDHYGFYHSAEHTRSTYGQQGPYLMLKYISNKV